MPSAHETLGEISGFLGRYPPFSALSDDALGALARQAEIEYSASGAEILAPGGAVKAGGIPERSEGCPNGSPSSSTSTTWPSSSSSTAPRRTLPGVVGHGALLDLEAPSPLTVLRRIETATGVTGSPWPLSTCPGSRSGASTRTSRRSPRVCTAG
jgi:hypothetical protein